MLNRLRKAVDVAIIPSAVVMILMLGFAIIIGVSYLISWHVIAVKSLIPNEALMWEHGIMPEISFYPLVLCLFVDLTILLFVCKFFNWNIDKALTIVFLIITAPISLPIILIMSLIENKGKHNTTISDSSTRIVHSVSKKKSNIWGLDEKP